MGRGFCWGDRSMEKGVYPMAVKYQSSLSQVSKSCSGLKASGLEAFCEWSDRSTSGQEIEVF